MLRADATVNERKTIVHNQDVWIPRSDRSTLDPLQAALYANKDQEIGETGVATESTNLHTKYPDGTYTVKQTFIDQEFPATGDQCVACEDRIEQDATGKLIYQGPLRQPPPPNVRAPAQRRDHELAGSNAEEFTQRLMTSES